MLTVSANENFMLPARLFDQQLDINNELMIYISFTR